MTGTKIVEEYDEVLGKYSPASNKSKGVLSRYEKAKIIGMRVEQLARNCSPTVEHKGLTIYEIAHKELQERKLPFLIARTLPNGVKEYWKLEDLVI